MLGGHRAVSGLYYLAMLPFRASLIGTHPVISELLNGSTEAIVPVPAFARVGHGSLAVVGARRHPGADEVRHHLLVGGAAVGREDHLAAVPGGSKHGPKFMDRVHKWGRSVHLAGRG